jgi:hypothetical protein
LSRGKNNKDLYKGLRKEEQRKKKELQKEAGPSDQKTNSFVIEKA